MRSIAPMRVLVVDDCEDAAITMASLLKHDGHEAIVAHSGEAALRNAPLFHPDVMFIDVAMPQIDGFTLARQFRQTTDFAETPLVAVSGYVDTEDQTRATEAGFTEFLPKPYQLAVLEALMERISSKVNASRSKAAMASAAAEQTRPLIERSRRRLDAPSEGRRVGSRIPVSIIKSGISIIVTLPVRSAADELRAWLKEHRCRVGPVFESDGQFTFFVYSKRHCIGELIAKNERFSLS